MIKDLYLEKSVIDEKKKILKKSIEKRRVSNLKKKPQNLKKDIRLKNHLILENQKQREKDKDNLLYILPLFEKYGYNIEKLGKMKENEINPKYLFLKKKILYYLPLIKQMLREDKKLGKQIYEQRKQNLPITSYNYNFLRHFPKTKKKKSEKIKKSKKTLRNLRKWRKKKNRYVIKRRKSLFKKKKWWKNQVKLFDRATTQYIYENNQDAIALIKFYEKKINDNKDLNNYNKILKFLKKKLYKLKVERKKIVCKLNQLSFVKTQKKIGKLHLFFNKKTILKNINLCNSFFYKKMEKNLKKLLLKKTLVIKFFFFYEIRIKQGFKKYLKKRKYLKNKLLKLKIKFVEILRKKDNQLFNLITFDNLKLNKIKKNILKNSRKIIIKYKKKNRIKRKQKENYIFFHKRKNYFLDKKKNKINLIKETQKEINNQVMKYVKKKIKKQRILKNKKLLEIRKKKLLLKNRVVVKKKLLKEKKDLKIKRIQENIIKFIKKVNKEIKKKKNMKKNIKLKKRLLKEKKIKKKDLIVNLIINRIVCNFILKKQRKIISLKKIKKRFITELKKRKKLYLKIKKKIYKYILLIYYNIKKKYIFKYKKKKEDIILYFFLFNNIKKKYNNIKQKTNTYTKHSKFIKSTVKKLLKKKYKKIDLIIKKKSLNFAKSLLEKRRKYKIKVLTKEEKYLKKKKQNIKRKEKKKYINDIIKILEEPKNIENIKEIKDIKKKMMIAKEMEKDEIIKNKLKYIKNILKNIENIKNIKNQKNKKKLVKKEKNKYISLKKDLKNDVKSLLKLMKFRSKKKVKKIKKKVKKIKQNVKKIKKNVKKIKQNVKKIKQNVKKIKQNIIIKDKVKSKYKKRCVWKYKFLLKKQKFKFLFQIKKLFEQNKLPFNKKLITILLEKKQTKPNLIYIKKRLISIINKFMIVYDQIPHKYKYTNFSKETKKKYINERIIIFKRLKHFFFLMINYYSCRFFIVRSYFKIMLRLYFQLFFKKTALYHLYSCPNFTLLLNKIRKKQFTANTIMNIIKMKLTLGFSMDQLIKSLTMLYIKLFYLIN